MRFFIALEIPDQNRIQLQAVQQHIRQLIPQVRLTENNKLHLTLAFIGQQPEELQEKLTDAVKVASLNIPPFKITPAYLDGFPNIHHPHTLWAGVKGDVDKLIVMDERLRDQLKDLLLPVDERRFVPHIALAKTTNLQISDQLEADLGKIMAAHFDPITISEIKLFESVPNEGFHKHNTLAEVRLGKQDY